MLAWRLSACAQLDHIARSHKSGAMARCTRLDEKILTEHFEEAGANARLLDATSALCASRACSARSSASLTSFTLSKRFFQGMDELASSFNMRTGDPCVLLAAWCDFLQLSLSIDGTVTVWSDFVDAAASAVSGNGMHGLLSGAKIESVSLPVLPQALSRSTSHLKTCTFLSRRHLTALHARLPQMCSWLRQAALSWSSQSLMLCQAHNWM